MTKRFEENSSLVSPHACRRAAENNFSADAMTGAYIDLLQAMAADR
jgi:hypothetical protein